MTAADHALAGHLESLSFGSRLRRLRQRAGFSQEALAGRSGVSVATIGALEEGQRRRPHPHTVVALADALGVTAEERTSLLAAAAAPPAPQPAAPATVTVPTQQPAPAAERPRLPVPPTALIGRESEVEACVSALDPSRSEVRLLTLTGPGGVGKTRLALAVAAALASTYVDGAVFVDLAPLRDERLVAATIAQALQLHGAGGRSAREQLLAELRERQVLLVLDNFEHVMGAAPLAAELLSNCARLAILVTSRTVTRLRWEQRFVVGPLGAPTDDAVSIETTAAAPAVRLFVERAQAIAPQFAIDSGNANVVASICRRLEGIPLAIELVAAWAELLGPQALLRRLERGLPLQLGGPSDLPERQQTLMRTLAWSYDLLEPDEQTLFRRLAVFVGGWTLEAVERVASGDGIDADGVLDLLGHVVDKSLVEVTQTGGESRYRFLEILREYAAERLEQAGEEPTLKARHVDWCVELAERAESALERPDGAGWFNRLESELDNLRMALDWTETAGDTESGLRLAGALRWFWDLRGHAREGRDHLEKLLAQAGADYRSPTLAKALNAAGYLAVYQDDHAAARAYCERAAALAAELGETHEQAYALRMLALTAWREGDLERAAALFDQALVAYEAVGDQQSLARATISLANVSWMQGQRERAMAGYQRGLALARAAGYTHEEAMALQGLGHAALVDGQAKRAAELLRDSLRLLRELGDMPCGSATLELCACIAAAAGDATSAAHWFGSAETTRQAMGRGFALETFRSAYDAGVAAARDALGQEAFDAAWAEGRRMTLEEALAQALA